MSGSSPTIQRRALSAELIRHRKEAGLTTEQVGAELDRSRGWLYGLENDKTKPNLATIRQLLDLYGVTDEDEREYVLGLARGSRVKGWWRDYEEEGIFRGPLAGLEAGAREIWTYDSVLVPGLLQTPDYAAAVFRGGQVLAEEADEADIARRVAARMERQKILRQESPPCLWAIIDEAALRKLVGGPEVMMAQLRFILEMAGWSNITMQVLPDAAGAHAAITGPFIFLHFPGNLHRSIVYLETATKSMYLEAEEDLETYTLTHSRAKASAASPEESIRYVASLMDELKQ
ncbi:helix-turn-helix domain-containing protein [Streptosporangium sp. NBC_01810]|uniref:helix-turn-helix domain-containing protein n=1 Tax=Streptosporangium sp. NBC_01810 TaxID=2975951 RepID=UPI002DD7D579|nr:helix-turn-helix transcriptional regulator [Streptosporangium sp. NBC_01810]WSA23643.1 helix-turn-helix domain-containing protein [Streptosporangium sp. NBC_01810]